MTEPTIQRHPTRPGVWRLTSEQTLPGSVDEVFAFFAEARNLEKLTPRWLRFHLETPGPIDMQAGRRIDYRLRVHGIPLVWQSEITLWQPPCRFVDEQRKGPYRFWRHDHSFLARPEGTLVRDQVDYAVPGGWLVNALLVRRDLRTIFAYRMRALQELFSGVDEATARTPAAGSS